MSRAIVKAAESVLLDLPKNGLTQLAQIARVDLDQAPESLALLGADELNRAEYSVLRAGAYFLALRAATAAPGQRSDLRTTWSAGSEQGFEAALEAHGVNPRQARRAIQIATYIAQLPPEQAARIAALPKRKILPLVNADQQVVEQLLDEGALDGNDPLSVRELVEQLKKTRKALEKSELELESARTESKALMREAADRHQGITLPPWAAAAREEAVCQGEAITAALDLLTQAWERDLRDVERAGLQKAEFERAKVAAAGTLYHVLAGVYAQAGKLLADVDAAFGTEVTRGLAPEFTLTADEVDAVDLVRRRIVDDAKLAAANRAIERANATPGKRGRKRKAVG